MELRNLMIWMTIFRSDLKSTLDLFRKKMPPLNIKSGIFFLKLLVYGSLSPQFVIKILFSRSVAGNDLVAHL